MPEVTPDATAPASDESAYQDRWWRAPDGLRLHARDYAGGAGVARLPVICIHGLTRNAADFEVIAPLIARSGRRVLAVDVRGRGRSERAPDPMTYRPDTYAKDILALMDQAGIARAVFLGTSMGGLITMALSALRLKAIAAVIMNDVGPEVAPEGLARIAAYTGKAVEINSWADAVAYARSVNAVAFPHYEDAQWQAFARRIFTEDEAGVPRLDYDPDISAPIRAAGGKALVPNLWPWFTRMARRRPLLVVRGQTSDLLSPAIAARMKKRARDMELVEVPGIGHAPMLDEPEARAAIFEFLGRVP